MKYKNLFEPIILGNTLFKNRIFASPTSVQDMSEECFPNAEVISYYEKKARGGVASVAVGEMTVHPVTSQSHSKQIHVTDPMIVPTLTALGNAISRYGAVATAELNHGGRFSHIQEKAGGLVKSPPFLKDGSGITYGPVEEVDQFGNVVHFMTEDVIETIIEAFGEAAAMSKKCGFGMICLHAGHGWLLSQFISPKVNTRNDAWGGSFEKRMRFPLAVIDSVRKAVGPRFPIEVRISGEDYISGYDLSYGVKIAQALESKVDLIHVSAGNHEGGFVITHPSMFMDDGCNVRLAAEIKKHVSVPVATVGALSDPEMMEEIIASGKADIVQLGRELLVEPSFANMIRTEKEDDVHRCQRCFQCFAYSFENRMLHCSINPSIGIYQQKPQPAEEIKKVLVVGGGIAGMQAAVTAAKRGHKVVLCEKSDRLGGVMLCEHEVPFKKKTAEYIDRQARIVNRQENIEVRLNTCVTPETAREFQPDAIIIAIGSEPALPPIPGLDEPIVVNAIDAFTKPEKLGKKVAILGGGLVGIELSIYLKEQGHDVEVLEMLPELPDGGNSIHFSAIKMELDRLNIVPRVSTKALCITGHSVKAEGPDGEVEIEADSIVTATGMKPKWEESLAFSDIAPLYYYVGDCRKAPGNMVNANSDGYYAAISI